MTLPTDDERPRYLLAADALRRDIASGKLKPGDKLPTNAELEKRFGIANMTVRNAVRVLREEGLVYSVQGAGSFVRQPPPPTPEPVPGTAVEADRSAEIEDMTARITMLEDRVSRLVTLLEQALPAFRLDERE